MTLITFYLVGHDYGWLSNSAPYPISLEGKMWYTSEHYFQTQKFHDLTIQKKILKTRSAAEVVRIAGNPKLRVRRDWDAVKLGVMGTAVRTKFTQITDLKLLLLNTGDAVLVEHNPHDSYWSSGIEGKGKNMLGVILMEIREELRRSQSD